MLMHQFIIFGILCFFVCVSIILWIKLRRIGQTLLILVIVSLFILSFGVGNYLISGSIRFDSFTHDMNTQAINLNDKPQFVSRGKAILNKFKNWNKIVRGKKPIYITDERTQIKVDSIGSEKSIKIIKRF